MKPRLLLGKLVTQLLPSARRPCCRSAAGLTPARQAAPWQSLFLTLFVPFCESSWSVVPMAAKIRGGLCRSSSRFHLKSRFAKLHRYPGLYPQNLLAEHGLPGSSVHKQGGAWACDRKKAIFMDLTSSPTTSPRTRGFPWRPSQSADPSNGCRSTFWEPGSGTPQGIPPGWI